MDSGGADEVSELPKRVFGALKKKMREVTHAEERLRRCGDLPSSFPQDENIAEASGSENEGELDGNSYFKSLVRSARKELAGKPKQDPQEAEDEAPYMTELKRYWIAKPSSEYLPNADELADPLLYWRQHSSTYPILYRLHASSFCQVATSVQPETFFSIAAYEESEKRRGTLAEDTLRDRLIVKSCQEEDRPLILEVVNHISRNDKRGRPTLQGGAEAEAKRPRLVLPSR